jgi:hypothetical protein
MPKASRTKWKLWPLEKWNHCVSLTPVWRLACLTVRWAGIINVSAEPKPSCYKPGVVGLQFTQHDEGNHYTCSIHTAPMSVSSPETYVLARRDLVVKRGQVWPRREGSLIRLSHQTQTTHHPFRTNLLFLYWRKWEIWAALNVASSLVSS